jgi:hypothetical protein
MSTFQIVYVIVVSLVVVREFVAHWRKRRRIARKPWIQTEDGVSYQEAEPIRHSGGTLENLLIWAAIYGFFIGVVHAGGAGSVPFFDGNWWTPGW